MPTMVLTQVVGRSASDIFTQVPELKVIAPDSRVSSPFRAASAAMASSMSSISFWVMAAGYAIPVGKGATGHQSVTGSGRSSPGLL
ncbi:MAG: hypothetical protein B7Z12_09435 [Caulobacter vibrioides]|uniref:Uncharacterized protein n=1 Tax=Caulobacter vibrioides TaxID=155892 RepID=A0A258D7E2_CAUVI|nr:MAG: hypothetical protein B7Z12_09435 [Caulobacter vibrioides]